MFASVRPTDTVVAQRIPDGDFAFVRHRGPITCVAGIPGQAAAVTSGYDSAVGYVDLAAQRMDLLGYHRHLVNRIVVNEAGTLAASCSSDYSVGIWDLRQRTLRRWLLGHWDDVEDFTFVDDRTGISASRDCRLLVWNLATGAIEQVLSGHERDALAVTFAAGKVYSSGDDMTLRQWDLATGAVLRTWGPFEVETDTCAIDGRHDRVVLGADDGKIRVFDSRSGARVADIPAHASGIKKVAVSPVNGDILSAAYDQKVLIWSADRFDLKVSLERHPATWERSFNWSPDGTGIMAGTFDGTVLLWDAETGRRCAEIGCRAAAAGNACLNDVSANGAGDMVVVSDDGHVRMAHLDPDAAAWTQDVRPTEGRVLMNAVTLDDRFGRVIAGAHDQNLHIFRRQGGGLSDETVVRLGEGPINCVRVARTDGAAGEIFAACYSGAILRVGMNGEICGRIDVHEGAVKALRLHPHKAIGVSCGADGLLLSWDFDGRLLARLPGHTAIVDDVDLDPTGTRVASTSRDFTVKVFDLESGRCLNSVFLTHRSPKSILFWDPETVFVGNYWGSVLRIDLRNDRVTGRCVADNGISALSRCGDRFVAVSYDGTASLIAPDDLRTVNRLRIMVQKPLGAPLPASVSGPAAERRAAAAGE
ncbi:MAG: WD40 repeat domain-containing protein [Rhodospirillales bacterium]|nr:WD40 repeat domain-containing protein [Rhodospirillales bacterium]